MSRAANVFTARVLDEESLVGEVTKHPRHDGIRESEETPCFLARDAEGGHLLELGANAEHRRIPQDVRQALGAAHLPCAIEHERLSYLLAFRAGELLVGELFVVGSCIRSTTCVTPSMPLTTVRACVLAVLVGTVPCSTTTPLFAVTSMEAFFIWLSVASCDLMRSASTASASPAATVGSFAVPDGAAAVGGAAAVDGGAGADAIVRLSSTRLTPSVVRASNRASARSVSSAISPCNVTTPALVVTTMWRPLMRSSMKYFDWMLVVIRPSSEVATGAGDKAAGALVPPVAAAPGVPPFTVRTGGGPATSTSKLSITCFTPSVFFASVSASWRSDSFSTRPFNVTTPSCADTLTSRALISRSPTNFA